MFDAWVNGRLPEAPQVNPILEDIEQLNSRALAEEADVLKMSFAGFPEVSEKYQILNAGAALGFGCGPLLVSKKPVEVPFSPELSVAIPGRRTSANLLLSTFFPMLSQKKEVLFSDIEEAVLSGKSDLGLLIHESRFTYAQKGLVKLADLGERWEQLHRQPIPLGCIAVRRSLPDQVKKRIERSLKQSVLHAFANPADSATYVRSHAAEMSEEVQRQHIELYVNRFSVDLGEEGRAAVRYLFNAGYRQNILPKAVEPIFLDYEHK